MFFLFRYKVRRSDFIKNDGESLLASQFNGSAALAVITVYSDHEYLPWLFPKTPNGYFSTVTNRKRYIKWLMDKIGVDSENKFTWEHFNSNHGAGLLTLYGGSPQAVVGAPLLSPLKSLGFLWIPFLPPFQSNTFKMFRFLRVAK